MSSIYSVRNVFEKDNKGKVVIIIVGVVIVILIMILIVLLVSGKYEDNSIQGNSSDVEVTQDEIPVSTEYNEEHRYTLNDYLPWTNYDYLEDGSGVDVKYDIAENTAISKGIVVTVSGCDEETNKANAKAYLSTIPVDLNEYEISYVVKECNK